MTFKVGNKTMESHSASRASFSWSELLEDSGSQRQIKNQELSLNLLCESLFSERQKLRQVLDWTHAFLSKGSEVHSEFCRAESLMLADEKEGKLPSYDCLSAAKYQHVSCDAGSGVFLGAGDDMEEVWKLKSNKPLCSYAKAHLIQISSTSQKHEVTCPKNMRSTELLDVTFKQTVSQDNKSKTSPKDCTSSCNSTYVVCKEREISGSEVEPTDLKFEKTIRTKKSTEKEKTEDAHMRELLKEQDSSPAFVLSARNQRNQDTCKDKLINSFETTQGMREMTSSLSNFKIPQTLTVHEQYQLCVDQLCDLGVRQREETKPVCLIKSPVQEGKTSEQTSSNPDNKPLIKVKSKLSMNKEMKKPSPDDTKYIKKMAALEHGRIKYRDNLRDRVKSKTRLDPDSKKCNKSIKQMTEATTSTDCPISISVEQQETDDDDGVSTLKKRTSFIINQGLCPKRKGQNPGVKHYFRGVKGQKIKAEGGGASLGLCEKSSGHLASSTENEIFQRPKSSQENRQTDRHQVKPAPACRKPLQCTTPTETQTALYDGPTPLVLSVGVRQCDLTAYKYSPAGVAVGEHCSSLPDEVWLSILSLLPLRDLCRVMQVCRRLLTLATDHTLWRAVRVEDATLGEHWLLSVGRRRPRSLSLYSCSGPSLPSCALEKFFTLCRNTLEVKLKTQLT
ncbi:uncharacterized protein LOC141790745 isoform X1 [Halichoeres trimaculatus]|uniref:uncharacterized protein LOC141790745 isoform X1 n=1 Tax=Halichoeres trimaculatus TaxID=147232 RepID=UPI003D9E3340